MIRLYDCLKPPGYVVFLIAIFFFQSFSVFQKLLGPAFLVPLGFFAAS